MGAAPGLATPSLKGDALEVRMENDDLLEALESAMSDGVIALDECGCVVEPDGECPCGNRSPLLDAGLI